MKIGLFLLPLLLLVPAWPNGREKPTAYAARLPAPAVSPIRTVHPSATSLEPVSRAVETDDDHDAHRGPGAILIDGLVNFFGPVRFDHAVHADMSRLKHGCASCHHQQDLAMTRVLACRACHAPSNGTSRGTFEMPGLKAAYHRHCLACHRDWSGANACSSCHEERSAHDTSLLMVHDPTDIVGVPHPRLDHRATFVFETTRPDVPFVTFHHADHIEEFGVACVECHGSSSCRGCHGTSASADRLPIDRHERCFSCHGEDRCTLCHDRAPRPRFDHEQRSGFRLGSHHASRACGDCHGPTHAFAIPASRSCRSCHAGANPTDFDHAATGVTLSGSHAYFECQRCHDERRPDAAPRCSGCHPDRAYPAQWPGLETPPATWTSAAEIRLHAVERPG